MTLFLEGQGKINRVPEGEGAIGMKMWELERKSSEELALGLHRLLQLPCFLW